MENKAHAMVAGIFVAALAALLLLLAGWLTRERGPRDIYEISTRQSVTGLQPQAPVRLRGVDIGKVSRIAFDPQVQGNVLIRMEVDEDVPLRQDTFATLSYQGVTGLAFVQLSDRGGTSPRLVPNDAAPPRIPLEAGLLSKLETKGEVIVDQVEEVTKRISRMLSEENEKRITSALASLDAAAGSARVLAGRLEQTAVRHLDPALDQATVTLRAVNRTAEDVSAAAQGVNRTAAEFERTANRLNAQGGPMDRLAEGTQALSHAADSFNQATLPRVNRTAEEAARTLRVLRRTVREVGDNPQQLLYGEGPPRPGPGEPGFQSPEVRR